MLQEFGILLIPLEISCKRAYSESTLKNKGVFRVEQVEPQERQSREEKPVVIPEFCFEPYRVPKRKKALYIAAAVVIGIGLLACLAYFCIILSVIIRTSREQANSAKSMARPAYSVIAMEEQNHERYA